MEHSNKTKNPVEEKMLQIVSAFYDAYQEPYQQDIFTEGRHIIRLRIDEVDPSDEEAD